VQYGVGYGTDTQVRGTIAWEDRRVNSAGHRFRTEMKAAAQSQSLDARYIVPIGDPATEKFTLQLTGQHERRADIDDQTTEGGDLAALWRFDAASPDQASEA